VPKFFNFGSDLAAEVRRLRLENENLKSQLIMPQQSIGSIKTAHIYASYPFNDRHEITLAVGAIDGIKEGMPVMIGDRVVLGKIKKVFPRYSIVLTVFDAEWRLPTRIASGINALMVGGSEPKLTMIDKNREVHPGDLVYAAAKGFPYGALIGKIQNVSRAVGVPFQEAGLELPYRLDNNLIEAQVLLEYAAD